MYHKKLSFKILIISVSLIVVGTIYMILYLHNSFALVDSLFGPYTNKQIDPTLIIPEIHGIFNGASEMYIKVSSFLWVLIGVFVLSFIWFMIEDIADSRRLRLKSDFSSLEERSKEIFNELVNDPKGLYELNKKRIDEFLKKSGSKATEEIALDFYYQRDNLQVIRKKAANQYFQEFLNVKKSPSPFYKKVEKIATVVENTKKIEGYSDPNNYLKRIDERKEIYKSFFLLP